MKATDLQQNILFHAACPISWYVVTEQVRCELWGAKHHIFGALQDCTGVEFSENHSYCEAAISAFERHA